MDDKSLKHYIDAEWRMAEVAEVRGDIPAAWNHLERSHIMSQGLALAHVKAHFKMLKLAFRLRNHGEAIGQVHRLILAGPASLLRVFPKGNVGSARVSATLPMAIPSDVQKILEACSGK